MPNGYRSTAWSACYQPCARARLLAGRGCQRSVVVPMLAMHMAMCNLFLRGCANFHHGDAQPQGLAGHRVIAVEHDGVTLDLHHSEHLRLSVGALALQLAANLHTRWKLGLGDGLHQALVA